MIPTARVPTRFNWGRKGRLLSRDVRYGKTGEQPSLDGTAEPVQLARGDFEQRLPTRDIFHDKCPFHTPAPNVTLLPFRFDQFVELPPMQLFRGPHLMLAAFPVVYLVVPTPNTADLVQA